MWDSQSSYPGSKPPDRRSLPLPQFHKLIYTKEKNEIQQVPLATWLRPKLSQTNSTLHRPATPSRKTPPLAQKHTQWVSLQGVAACPRTWPWPPSTDSHVLAVKDRGWKQPSSSCLRQLRPRHPACLTVHHPPGQESGGSCFLMRTPSSHSPPLKPLQAWVLGQCPLSLHMNSNHEGDSDLYRPARQPQAASETR